MPKDVLKIPNVSQEDLASAGWFTAVPNPVRCLLVEKDFELESVHKGTVNGNAGDFVVVKEGVMHVVSPSHFVRHYSLPPAPKPPEPKPEPVAEVHHEPEPVPPPVVVREFEEPKRIVKKKTPSAVKKALSQKKAPKKKP